MFSIFMCLVLGAQQIHDGQLNAIYITSIILMILTLFEQAVPMSNVAYYKADTDQALEEIHEVIVPNYKILSEHTNLKRMVIRLQSSVLQDQVKVLYFMYYLGYIK